MKSKSRTVARLSDMRWAFDRLDHLLTVYDEGCIGKAGMAGADDTMNAVREALPDLMKRYRWPRCWPHGRARAKSQ